MTRTSGNMSAQWEFVAALREEIETFQADLAGTEQLVQEREVKLLAQPQQILPVLVTAGKQVRPETHDEEHVLDSARNQIIANRPMFGKVLQSPLAAFRLLDSQGTGRLNSGSFHLALGRMGLHLSGSQLTTVEALLDRESPPDLLLREHGIDYTAFITRLGSLTKGLDDGDSGADSNDIYLLLRAELRRGRQAGGIQAFTTTFDPGDHGMVPAEFSAAVSDLVRGLPTSTLDNFTSELVDKETGRVNHGQFVARLFGKKPVPGRPGGRRPTALHLSEEELQERMVDQVFNVLRQQLASQRSLYGKKLKDPRKVFELMDRSGDGSLDVEEFGQALARLGLGLGEKQLTLVMKACDQDGDGDISYEEFASRLGTWLNMIRASDAPS